MKGLIDQRYLMRRNVIGVIAFCLLAYFGENVFFGQRSIFRLIELQAQIATASTNYDHFHDQRVSLESAVVRLRPATLDPDLLEQRARTVLGFAYPDERIIVTAGAYTAPLAPQKDKDRFSRLN